jgi:phosphomevalonate kinase
LKLIPKENGFALNSSTHHTELHQSRFVLQAINTFCELVSISRPFRLSVLQHSNSFPIDALPGSSAAVTVACIKALALFERVPLNSHELFKLSALSHLQVQNFSGSCADIAASSFGGVLSFRSPDVKHLRHLYFQGGTQNVLHDRWPHLSMAPLRWPETLAIQAFWSGIDSSTTALMRDVDQWQEREPVQYEQLMQKINHHTQNLINLLMRSTPELTLGCINALRGCFAELQRKSGANVYPEKLRTLCAKLNTPQRAIKPSGAGGGDYLIAFESVDEKSGEASSHALHNCCLP